LDKNAPTENSHFKTDKKKKKRTFLEGEWFLRECFNIADAKPWPHFNILVSIGSAEKLYNSKR
jgi:hypothetical protein